MQMHLLQPFTTLWDISQYLDDFIQLIFNLGHIFLYFANISGFFCCAQLSVSCEVAEKSKGL